MKSDWDDLTTTAKMQIGNALLYTFWCAGPIGLAIICYFIGHSLVWAGIGAFLGIWPMLLATEVGRLMLNGAKLAERRANVIAGVTAGVTAYDGETRRLDGRYVHGQGDGWELAESILKLQEEDDK